MRKTIRLFPIVLLYLLLLPLGSCGKTPDTSPTTVSLGGWDYAPDTRAIFLAGDNVGEEELRAALTELPALQKLEYPRCSFDPAIQLRLAGDFPGVRFVWPVTVNGQAVMSDQKKLTLTDPAMDIQQLITLLPLFPDLETVDLGEKVLSDAEFLRLRELCPRAEFLHTIELFGRTFPSTAEEISLREIPMEDTAAVEAALPHFPALKRVDMSYCGIDNETMDALDRRYADIRFVWVVQVMDRDVPTDTTWYIKYTFPLSDAPPCGPENLRYCPDIIALDLGHTHVTNESLSFLPTLTHMRYLILAITEFRELTWLKDMQELEYLEIFATPVTDLSPLLELPNLRSLNISACYQLAPDSLDILRQMTQLECLSYSLFGVESSLREANPDCFFIFINDPDEVVSCGWRDQHRYFEMRDALHMYYMIG